MSKKLPLIGLLIVLMLTVSIVAAQGGLPGAGWKSGQQIQNTDTAESATIVLTAYDLSGTSAPCGSETVGPGASITFLTDVHCSVSAGFVGSAVASADKPIAAIVNVNNKGVGAAAGQYRGTDGSDVATTIVFPLVKNDHSGRTTTFYVQNASGSLNTITAVFNIKGTTYQKIYSNVPANAMVVINPSDTDTPGPVPSGQGNVGSLSVTGTQPMAGSSLEHETSAVVAQNLQASKAFTPSDYDQVLYCPLVRNNHTSKSQTTGVQVQNLHGSAQTVTITYQVGGTTYGPFTSPSLATGESYTYLSSGVQGLPSGLVGSAKIEGSLGNIVAVVNDKGYNTSNPQRVTTYACFADASASTTINLPLVKEFKSGNTTGVQVQNVGSSSATVTATYTSTGGDSVVFQNSTPLAAGSSVTFYGISNQPSSITYISGDPLTAFNGTINGVVLTSTQPIVAIVNESSYSGTIQDTKNYEGFNQ